jgi:hypothetical protein
MLPERRLRGKPDARIKIGSRHTVPHPLGGMRLSSSGVLSRMGSGADRPIGQGTT